MEKQEGIRGWLLVLAIAVIGTIISLGNNLLSLVLDSAFEDLIEQGIVKIVFSYDIIMLALMLVVAYCFFLRKNVTPRLISGVLLVNAAGIGSTFVYAMAEAGSIGDEYMIYVLLMLVASIVYAAVWIPYLKRSNRVKATFVVEANRNLLHEKLVHVAVRGIRSLWRTRRKLVVLVLVLVAVAGLCAGGIAAIVNQRRRQVYDFYWAAAAGDIEELRSFIDRGMDVNAVYKGYERTVLCDAIAQDDLYDEGKILAAVDELLRAGADPNLCGHDATTPLLHAIRRRMHRVATYLLDHGAVLTKEDADACLKAITEERHPQNEVLAIAEMLASAGADPAVALASLIESDELSDHSGLARVLMKHVADPDAKIESSPYSLRELASRNAYRSIWHQRLLEAIEENR